MKLIFQFVASSLLVLSLVLVPVGRAQISVGPAGAGPVTFDQPPPASEWATRSTAGGFGNILSQSQMDAAAQSNSVALFTNALSSTTGSPPAANSFPMYASDGRYLVTRPTGALYGSCVSTLRNDSGTTMSGLLLACDLGALSPAVEELPGLSVYFSLTGTPGSWQFIPGLSGTNGSVARTAEIPLGTWLPEASLYLLWTDDNATSTDTAYTIDNLFITPLAPGIARQPQPATVAPGGSANFDVDARGAPPLRYQWYKGATPIPFATNQFHTVAGASPVDEAVYSVTVSNAHGGVVSSGAALTVGCFAPVSITVQPQAQVLNAGGTVALSIGVTGTQPLAFQWYRGGAPVSGATNQSLIKSNALGADSGLYHVLVSNCLGNVASMSVVVSVPDPSFTLLGLTNQFWRYNQSGANLGAVWRGTNYDDSAWLQGRGVLAQENLPALNPLTNTVLWLTPPGGGSQLATYYFRAAFTFTNEPAEISLVASNYVDDGAVFYLNGQEAFRYNMPAGTILNGTLASAANPLGEGYYIVSNLPPQLLRSGQNLLAVEVHQSSLTSADVAFGMVLLVVPLAPTLLQITNQPLDVTVAESRPVSFSVGVDGVAGRYQWFKDGVAIPGATASTLNLVSALGSDQGFYSVVVSNLINVVTSRVAALLVDVDVTPPALCSADVVDATHVLLSFSEPVLATTATNAALYSITNTFGGVAVVHGAVLTNGTNVLLTTSALAPGVNYILTAAGVQDISPQHNALPKSAVPVARTLTAVGLGSAWDYFEPFPPFTVADPGPGWNLPGFDLTEWGHEFAAFAYAQNPSFAAPVPVQTTLVVSPAYASYFRATFSAAVSQAGLSTRLRHAIDDGAVFYLNGVEVHRYNMPAGPVSASTPAASALVNPFLGTPLEIPSSRIHAGTNLFAAELHQSAPNALQKFFAAELILRAESLLVGPLRVLAGPADVTVTELQPATFRVSTVAATSLQWQVNGVNVPGATNDTLTQLPSLAENGASVRCVCSGVGGPIVTASATLRVLPDLTRPVLLGAVMNSNGFIVLSFSKPLDAASAGLLANYTLTNNSGATVPLTGATLVDDTNVWLSLSGLLGAGPVVVVNGVFDQAAQPNVVAPGSAARVGADYLIPFDAAWKYLLISTNETVQAGFMAPGYDDSGWLGPSNGLFYVEDAALPAAKNTLLSFFDGTGINRINTHYFRKAVFLPLLATNMVLQLRHITDDGMVLHLNGQEIYRFNMPGGTVTAGTQAAANTGDAIIVGPVFLSLTNFIAGTNVFAVDVHQQGAASADVVMGVELRVQNPGGVLPPVSTDPQARLAAVPTGDVLALVWGEPGFVLEQAGSVNGPWLPVATVSPVFVSATNAAAFYRLRR